MWSRLTTQLPEKSLSVGATRWVARKTPKKRNERCYGVIPKRFNNSTMAVLYPLALSSVTRMAFVC